MSELINTKTGRRGFHRRLLTSASTLALIGFLNAGIEAKAADEEGDHPSVWIELGGQLSQLEDGQETFAPALMTARPSMFSPAQPLEHPPRSSIDEIGKISFQ